MPKRSHAVKNLETKVAVSKAFYLNGKSKVQIAEELGISRFMVARALEAALDEGIVTVTVNTGLLLNEVSQNVEQHLGLDCVRVVDAHGKMESLRSIVAREAGSFLAGTLKDGEVLGLGWGRTINTLLDHLDNFPKVGVISLSGQFKADVQGAASALNKKALALTGQRPAAISGPFFLEDSVSMMKLRRTRQVTTVTGLFKRITTAVIAVGSIQPDFMSVAYTGVPFRFSEEVRASGAVGEVCGNLFGYDGRTVEARVSSHKLSISADELKRIPRVVAVVCGKEKAPALRSVCASGTVTDLVIDIELAEAILSLPPVESKKNISTCK